MITLNLISEKEKKEIQLLDTYITVKDFLLLLLVGIIVSSIMLLAGKVILLKHFVQTVEGNALSSVSMKISNTDIRNLKSEIAFLQEVQNNHVNWINFFENFSKIVNSGIIISSINIDKKGSLFIAGTAKIRQNLIDFESNINNSGYFKAFKFPYDILFKKDNIIFSANLEFDPGKITKKNP